MGNNITPISEKNAINAFKLLLILRESIQTKDTMKHSHLK